MSTRREVLARLREIVRERRDLEQEARAILRENAAACTPYQVGDELIETTYYPKSVNILSGRSINLQTLKF